MIREQHRARDERAVGFGKFSFIHAAQRFGCGFGVQLETRRCGDGDRTRLAFHIQRVNSRHGQRRALRIELIIVGDDECVTAPSLVLQPNRPHITALFLAADVWAGELDVFPVRRNFHAKLLHALIDQTVTNRRAAADQSIADGDEIKNLRDDARGKPLRAQGKFPIRRICGEGQQFIGARRKTVHGNLPQADEFRRLELDACGRSRADLCGFFRRTDHAQGFDGEFLRERFQRLFQLNINPTRAEHAVREADAQFSVGNLPIIHAFTTHIRHDEASLRQQFDLVDARLLDVERECVIGEQPRLFETRRGAVVRSHDRLDAFEPERERERPRAETIRRE